MIQVDLFLFARQVPDDVGDGSDDGLGLIGRLHSAVDMHLTLPLDGAADLLRPLKQIWQDKAGGARPCHHLLSELSTDVAVVLDAQTLPHILVLRFAPLFVESFHQVPEASHRVLRDLKARERRELGRQAQRLGEDMPVDPIEELGEALKVDFLQLRGCRQDVRQGDGLLQLVRRLVDVQHTQRGEAVLLKCEVSEPEHSSRQRLNLVEHHRLHHGIVLRRLRSVLRRRLAVTRRFRVGAVVLEIIIIITTIIIIVIFARFSEIDCPLVDQGVLDVYAGQCATGSHQDVRQDWADLCRHLASDGRRVDVSRHNRSQLLLGLLTLVCVGGRSEHLPHATILGVGGHQVTEDAAVCAVDGVVEVSGASAESGGLRGGEVGRDVADQGDIQLRDVTHPFAFFA
mmetsp:Transcript_18981/g.54403  ORF Transcript_18981/g.54403 Transcript_18981/m.54403 type:complete len:400 (+) Transcript_18981:1092-2291(+)